jgi:hypothetical protein
VLTAGEIDRQAVLIGYVAIKALKVALADEAHLI